MSTKIINCIKNYLQGHAFIRQNEERVGLVQPERKINMIVKLLFFFPKKMKEGY